MEATSADGVAVSFEIKLELGGNIVLMHRDPRGMTADTVLSDPLPNAGRNFQCR
jgi:hypothetical protein